MGSSTFSSWGAIRRQGPHQSVKKSTTRGRLLSCGHQKESSGQRGGGGHKGHSAVEQVGWEEERGLQGTPPSAPGSHSALHTATWPVDFFLQAWGEKMRVRGCCTQVRQVLVPLKNVQPPHNRRAAAICYKRALETTPKWQNNTFPLPCPGHVAAAEVIALVCVISLKQRKRPPPRNVIPQVSVCNFPPASCENEPGRQLLHAPE